MNYLLLLFLFGLVSFRLLFGDENILGSLEIGQLTEALVVEVTQSHIILKVYLIEKLLANELFLYPDSLFFQVEHFVSFFWAEMWLVVKFFHMMRLRLFVSVRLDLL